MATLLRKIGLIRLHSRDTEDPKHHHHRSSSSSQQGSSLRGRGNQKNSSNKPQPQGPPGGGCSSSSGEGSPGGHKNKKAPEPGKQPPQPARPGVGREKPREAGREPGAGREAAQRPGPGPGPGCGSALVPAGRQQHCTQVRTRRLMKELQDIARLSDRFISVELVDESLFDWNVKLHQVDKDSVLWQDMKETNTEYILLNLTFPDNFPFSPPFMRVLSPRLENGYVLDGGAICMELLTPRGWSSAYTVEAVMRQFAASLVKGQSLVLSMEAGDWTDRQRQLSDSNIPAEFYQIETAKMGLFYDKQLQKLQVPDAEDLWAYANGLITVAVMFPAFLPGLALKNSANA
ncbi:hypothetical protein HGM15179_000552 [Zosterops borbonicus]|uniref:Ubiquitin-conjugating enzyme E2Q-like protein 1 n=1 Tax=Zosterops borbonicus TaxID=364589 RepID=A0A8K1GW63_9PASS|nr:hypothetical protein HGM15179_000552 [Zosterops borbonicus]